MITETAEETKAEGADRSDGEVIQRIVEQLGRQSFEKKLDTLMGLTALVNGEPAVQGTDEQAEQRGAGIPSELLGMLRSAPAESLAMAHALIAMGSKNGETWNSIIDWLDEEIERFRRGDFGGLDVELEQLPICQWLAFELGMSICEDE